MSQTTGQQLIADERQRQIDADGWTIELGDQHSAEELERAACSYRDAEGEESAPPDIWPWEAKWWKPKSRQHNLVRAGALFQSASDVAERAGDFKLRDCLREQVECCAYWLSTINS